MNRARPNDSDLEALVNSKIKAAIRAAVDKIGERELSKITGVAQSRIDMVLNSDKEYLPVKVISVVCKINKSHGDPNLEHSSVSECIKGTTVRLPFTSRSKLEKEERPTETLRMSPRRGATAPMLDQKSLRLANFGAYTATILLMFYFLGGIILAPLFNLPVCVGLSLSPPSLSPCAGSILGLIIGAFASLAYTYYYFTREV